MNKADASKSINSIRQSNCPPIQENKSDRVSSVSINNGAGIESETLPQFASAGKNEDIVLQFMDQGRRA